MVYRRVVRLTAENGTCQNEKNSTIQAIYPSMEDPIALICNDEGKLLGLPLNRPLFDEDGNLYDIIAGTFFVAGLSDDDFASLSPELIQKYSDRFKTVYLFR